MAEDFDDLAAVTFDRDDDSVVVIVGSGAGGGTLANELAQKGIDVVVLEAGPRFQDSDFENDEYAMHERLTWNDKRLCTGTSPIAENFAAAPTWVCKAVGGSTLHWTGTCVRFHDFEFSARTSYGGIAGANVADWPLGLAELAPYYDRAEDKMGVTGTGGIPFHPPGNNYKVMAVGARRIGYTQVDTNRMAINSLPRDGRNACDQIGFCMQGCRSGARWSTSNVEIPKAETTGRCEVRPQCMALRIEHDDRGRAAGVLYADASGARQMQKARAVCIAGNAIETPRLLLNSESSTFPDGLANGSGLVGKNYMRHVFAYAYAQFERPVNMHRGIQVGGAIRDERRNDPSRGFAGSFLVTTAAYGLPFYGAFLDTNMPIIVALNGLAAGGGFVIASLGDIRVMSDQARLIMAEINIGLPSIFGSYYLMSQVFLSRTVDIVLTGRDIPAEEAKRIGWAHEVVPPGEVMERAKALAAELVAKAPTPLRLTVTRFRTVAKREFAEVAESLTRYQMEAVATGEPARVMAGFFAERERRKAAG